MLHLQYFFNTFTTNWLIVIEFLFLFSTTIYKQIIFHNSLFFHRHTTPLILFMFQFLNNITYIFIHFFIYMYFKKLHITLLKLLSKQTFYFYLNFISSFGQASRWHFSFQISKRKSYLLTFDQAYAGLGSETERWE